MLWKDKASKEQKNQILTLAYSAFKLTKLAQPLEEFADYIQMKIRRIENLINECKKNKLSTSQTFLTNALEHAFVVGRSVKDNFSTSLTERAMRTIKQRTSYAVWSNQGAENVIKVRLNHYYNNRFIGLYFDT